MFDGKTLSWIHFPKVDSTNLWVKEHAATLPHHALTIALSDEQTAGRGQHGKKWVSPPGVNLYATLFFCLEKEFAHLSNLGQICALSCAKVLEGYGFSTQIKWPNDLRLGSRKVGGILTETMRIGEEWGVAIGIGLNVNLPEELLMAIDQPATSLFAESGQQWKPEEILSRLVQRFLLDLSTLREKGFSSLAIELQGYLAFLHQAVLFSDGKRSFEAICQGIDETGKLLLLRPNGNVEKVLTGSLKAVAL